jgi:hypothetical protein
MLVKKKQEKFRMNAIEEKNLLEIIDFNIIRMNGRFSHATNAITNSVEK